ncbi:hypothetical protein JCM8547_006688 [Rhodosporidiobolus lusitaniae]
MRLSPLALLFLSFALSSSSAAPLPPPTPALEARSNPKYYPAPVASSSSSSSRSSPTPSPVEEDPVAASLASKLSRINEQLSHRPVLTTPAASTTTKEPVVWVVATTTTTTSPSTTTTTEKVAQTSSSVKVASNPKAPKNPKNRNRTRRALPPSSLSSPAPISPTFDALLRRASSPLIIPNAKYTSSSSLSPTFSTSPPVIVVAAPNPKHRYAYPSGVKTGKWVVGGTRTVEGVSPTHPGAPERTRAAIA